LPRLKKFEPWPKLDPAPPEGITSDKVYWCNDKGQRCKPLEAVMYTWTGHNTWIKIKKEGDPCPLRSV
jgi:hypothetical protein